MGASPHSPGAQILAAAGSEQPGKKQLLSPVIQQPKPGGALQHQTQ